MRKRAITIITGACLALALFAAPAAAEPFGLSVFDVAFTDPEGNPTRQAGSHPAAMSISLAANVDEAEPPLPTERFKDVVIEQIAGLSGDTTEAHPRCSIADFLDIASGINGCPPQTTLGITATATFPGTTWFTAPLFNLQPPPGVLLRLGFRAVVQNVVIDVSLDPEHPHRPIGASRNIPQLANVYANKLQLWGHPSSEENDDLRGTCGFHVIEGGIPHTEVAEFEFENPKETICPVSDNGTPFLTLPTNCSPPGQSTGRSDYEAFSWNGSRDAGSALLREGAAAVPFSQCGGLPAFDPTIDAVPTSRAAESPTGLDLALEIDNPGLTSAGGRSKSHIRAVELALPEGMTANPSLAEGLEACSEPDLDDETLGSGPGDGCPEASKIGMIEVDSPLVDRTIEGALYQAEPYANLADDSLLAFYIVLKNPDLGIIVKQTVRVEPDPETGRLVGITEDIPQLPFSSFRLRFREGARSPLITPPLCGDHAVEAKIVPWSGSGAVEATSTFELRSGPGEGPCPPGAQPFEPGFAAGSHSNAAGQFSPFSMRLTRRDGDQDLVRFDATLPQGVLARLAGVGRCPDAQIALAEAKSGKAELAAPSCPLDSRIGRVLSGAGVGSQLTYVPGTVYLAGPFGGAPLSAVAIVPAVAGPFDVGTVVVRQALVVDPRSGEVTADGALSEPIPHILAGIPLRVRDVQVHIDRPGFTLNPTSCDRMATAASIWGGGQDPFSLADDAPASRSAPYQAASCERLAFRPRLALRLKGGTRRGAHPALRTVFRPRAGNANARKVVVRFPRSAFVEQAHIRTVCTRVQFAADACPKGSIYGRVAAFTPLLDNPLRGPVYLRSSNNTLPDLVFDLKGEVDFEAVARIDSVKGALRAIAHGIPDAPISRVVIQMQGGRKGLIVNSRNLCKAKNRARTAFDAHSGKSARARPVVAAAGCGRRAVRSAHRRAGGSHAGRADGG